MEKIQIVSKCLKWRDNWLKKILDFMVKNGEKNLNCSILPEMARKLLENDFWIFYPPQKWGPIKEFGQN